MKREIIIKDTHRGLRYEDGVLTEVLGAGRHTIPRQVDLGFYRSPKVEVTLVDMRERDLTIKGQEILTADKVAIRVSIVVQFRVSDPRAAMHEVANYEERLYTDVQLAARRSLTSMTLEEILTNRNRLSEDILRDVKEAAANYGVAILRADVKDLVFPGNLQEIMNRVLAAERMSQAQLVEARTKAETQRIEAQVKAETQRIDAQIKADAHRAEAEAQAAALKFVAQADAEATRVKTGAEIDALREREQAAGAYSAHPALLRLQELETLRVLARTANARIYIGFDKHRALEPATTRNERDNVA
jgi:regulator of protease activity HflC (stomatin/prohibitin superfamily)